YGVPGAITDIFGGSKKANEYAKVQSKIANSAEKILKAWDLPKDQHSLDLVKGALTPQPGEDDKGYPQRMASDVARLYERLNQAQETLGSGYQLNEKQNPKEKTANSSNNTSNFDVYEAAKQLGVDATDISHTAKHFDTTPEIIVGALRAGVKTEKQFKNWVRDMKNG